DQHARTMLQRSGSGTSLNSPPDLLLSMPLHKANIQMQSVNILDPNMPIEDGFHIITKVLSAPLFDKDRNQFIGILDIRHFLGYILYKLPLPPSGMKEKQVYLRDLDRSQYTILDRNSTISELLKYFNTGLHSAFVLNEMKQIEVITQISFAKWIKDNIERLGSIKEQPIKDIFKGEQHHNFAKVHSIENSKSVVEALKELYTKNIYGMPVVDKDHRIVGNFSIIDIKEANDNLDMLILPLKDYFGERPIFSCSQDGKLAELLDMFVQKKIHRVYLTEKGQPVGIVTITDVIDMLYLNLTYRATGVE
ncbi:hypothetical protein SAMD00019534_017720, partial [Acytostelium subglobosum LB1]|uniref:hypothetical protein n=1 Tax=Acytostelium subglobosum LB1 TaxID=1410327 RepID=UPI000644CB18